MKMKIKKKKRKLKQKQQEKDIFTPVVTLVDSQCRVCMQCFVAKCRRICDARYILGHR